ncbi:hypothetical protein SZ55_4425 [Pseudomonas sp. FeS53a]|jgi:hypothetical protein|nr:hypothetical protein SZ55_4425 [Pseudomonas sp. FeS53a]
MGGSRFTDPPFVAVPKAMGGWKKRHPPYAMHTLDALWMTPCKCLTPA